ncbi:hypothetical protein ENLAB_24090 [Enterococcus innesii]|uniref:Autolysin modifier protein n=2 Tax=Enterococcus innesii TaxID=2839759 RepID=A0ABN6NRL7_9ENTE|nr:immunoglobulin-like domain-containing protein [Enterococcus innesii]BDG68845.1 hypothetical protein ENLAB_24090 [Enterococcus innesii]
MNNKFSKKVTGLLLISHLTLSALPINAMATEKASDSLEAPQERVEAPNLLSDGETTQDLGNEITATNDQENQETDSSSIESEEAQTEASTENSSENNEAAENEEQTDASNGENSENSSDDSSENAAETRSTRASVQVTSDAELRTALANATVTQISLANNITMTSSVTWTGTTKTIEGNGHTLTFGNNVRLYGNTVNQGLSIRNVRIVAHATNTIYQNRTSSVSFTNVTHENSHATGRLLYLAASNSSANFFGENRLDAGSLIWATSNVRMNIGSGASVVANNNGTARAIYLASGGRIDLGEGSLLDVTQNNPSNTAKAVLIEGSASSVVVNSNATFKITSAPNTQKTQEALGLRGALTVLSGGTLDVVGRSTYSTVNVGQSSTFHEGSNVRIQNNHTNGTAIGSYPGTTNYTIHSSTGMQTWRRSADFSGEPSFNYPEFRQGSFSLNTYTNKQVTSRIESNDSIFNATFNSSQIGKIAFGDFVDTATIQQTTIDDLTTSSTHITGRAEPNADLAVTIEGQGSLTGRVASDGTYQFAIPNAPLAVGTKVTVTATANGIQSVAETVVEDSEKETIAETTISDLNTDSTSVTGTAEPNAEITIKAGDTIIANGRVGSDGIYALTIEKQQAGTVVTAQATLNGISSNIAETMVERATIAETTLNQVTTTDTTVSGTAEPDAHVEITIGDSETKNATVDSEGNFEVEIDQQAAGTIITAQASIDGLQSNIASTIVVTDPANTEGTITPDTYNVSSGDQFLRGTYTGDVASARVYVNGSSVRGGNFADGSFEFFIGNRIQSVDDVVEIEALDQYGKVLDRTTVELTRDLAGTITPDQYRVGETMITGTFTGDVNFARLVINGTPSNAWGGTFNADGTFSFYVANLGIKAGDKVEIQALNRQINGNTEAIEVLETKEVTVIDQLQGTITPDKYNYTDTTITGTFTGDINFANLVIDGQSVGNWGGTFNKETGRFEFFVHAQFRDQIRTAAKVELQTYHRETVDGQTIDHKLVLQPVEIVKATGSIQPAAFKVTDSEITGTFTGNVNFANLIVDGRSVSWGGTFNTTDQTFTYFVNQDTRNLIRDAETVELVAYHREVVNGRPVDTELDRSVVTIDKEFIGTITPDPYKLGDRTITGTYTGDDINFGRLEIDGMILWVSGFADGTFTAYLNQEQANRVTKDSKMTIHALHRFADLSTREIAQATVSITE